jgi:hypothetical protein
LGGLEEKRLRLIPPTLAGNRNETVFKIGSPSVLTTSYLVVQGIEE